MMDAQQQAAYNQWLSGGGFGSPPDWVFVDRGAQAQQQAQAAAAQQQIQTLGLGNMFDLGGTGYGSAYQQQQMAAARQPASGLPLASAGTGAAPTSAAAPTIGPWSYTDPNATATAAALSGGRTYPANPDPAAGFNGGTTNINPPGLGAGNDFQAQFTAWLNGGGVGPPPVYNGPATASDHPGTGAPSDPAMIAWLQGGMQGPPPPPSAGQYGPGATNDQILQGSLNTPPNTQTSYGGGVTPGSVTTMPPSGGGAAQPPGGRPPVTTTGGGGGTPVGPPGSVPISWPTNVGANGPTYGGDVRNLGGELGAISSFLNPFAQQSYNLSQELSPYYTQLNLSNYGNALGGLSGMMRGAWNDTNPEQAGYNQSLLGQLNYTNSNYPGPVNAQGYDAQTGAVQWNDPNYSTYAPNVRDVNGRDVAATSVSANSGYTPVQTAASNAGLNWAQDRLSSFQPSALQQQLEQQAGNQLALGSSLSPEEVRQSQQAAREGWSARGLVNSPGAVAEEVLNRYNMGQQRLQQRQGFAQQVDQTGFNQQQQNFGSALGLSNAALGYGNLGLEAQRANLGAQMQGSQLGLQAGMANQDNYLRAGLANQDNSLRAQLANQGVGTTLAQLGMNNSQFNATAGNNMAQFNSNLGAQMQLANLGALNQAAQYNTGQQNSMGQFNANLAQQNNQNAWNNSMGYGQYIQGQAINPFATAGAMSGGQPDYLPNMLGYGGDLFNTNYNAAQAAKIAAANNSAAKTGAEIGGAAKVAGAVVATKVFFACIPEGEKIDTPNGPKPIEDVRAGDTVTGYSGSTVRVLQKHEYAENPHAERFFRFTLDDGGTFALCDRHRISGVPAKEFMAGDLVAADNRGTRTTAITRFGGVVRSYDLLTEDIGYRMAGVPVNSMIEELATATRELATAGNFNL